MSEPKFTPGPWQADYEHVYASNGDEVAICETGNWEADAHLIAAAPDMYAELFNAAQTFAIYAAHHIAKGDMEKADKNLALVGRINDVLIKARGEGCAP